MAYYEPFRQPIFRVADEAENLASVMSTDKAR